jgi:hypothetical protein
MKRWRNIGSKTSRRANVETDRATIAALPTGTTAGALKLRNVRFG